MRIEARQGKKTQGKYGPEPPSAAPSHSQRLGLKNGRILGGIGHTDHKSSSHFMFIPCTTTFHAVNDDVFLQQSRDAPLAIAR
jgi:hypothetical protein